MEQTQESKSGIAEFETGVVEYLQLGVGITALLMQLKDSTQARFILRSIPALAGELKAMLEGMNDFCAEMDIAAVRKMEAAGISQENAVALRARHSNLLGGIAKAISKELKELRGVESKVEGM